MKLMYRLRLLLVMPLLALVSCQDFFEVSPEDMLERDDYENGKNSIYSAFVGVVGTVREQMDRHIILTELLGDLVTPTEFAPEEYDDVYRYRPAADNKVASPAPYYRIILETNDFLRHIVSFEDKYPGVVPAPYYRGMIATVINYRAWSYLQLAKIYGEAVYYDYSLNGKNNLDKEPMLNFDDIIQEMIYFMTNGVDGIDAWEPLDWKTLLNVYNEEYNRCAIDPDVLLCELCLWNKDYQKAIKCALKVIKGTGWRGGTTRDVHLLTCSNRFSRGGWMNIFNGYNIEETSTGFLFDYTKNQTHSLQNVFSNMPPNSYYLAPSEVILAKYKDLSNQGDERGGKNGCIQEENGKLAIQKYHFRRDANREDGPINIFRGAEIHLMLAEALCQFSNKDDQSMDAAELLINKGLKPFKNGAQYNAPFDAIIWRTDKLRECIGVRGRSGAKIWESKKFIPEDIRVLAEVVGDDSTYHEVRRRIVDSLLAEETALEFVGEGKRWFTLMRIARALDRPEMLAKPISMKFPEGEREIFESWLMDPKNWFIKVEHRGKVQ